MHLVVAHDDVSTADQLHVRRFTDRVVHGHRWIGVDLVALDHHPVGLIAGDADPHVVMNPVAAHGHVVAEPQAERAVRARAVVIDFVVFDDPAHAVDAVNGGRVGRWHIAGDAKPANRDAADSLASERARGHTLSIQHCAVFAHKRHPVFGPDRLPAMHTLTNDEHRAGRCGVNRGLEIVAGVEGRPTLRLGRSGGGLRRQLRGLHYRDR